MAFEFHLSTDAIRERMFDFIKPVYKNTYDFDVGYINWIYGVYDSESGFFLTYVNTRRNDTKYILLTRNGDGFYVTADRYRHILSGIPEVLTQYSERIQEIVQLYGNERRRKVFEESFSVEEQKRFDEITEHMRDRSRPDVAINSYEDAERLFYQENFSYYYISHLYNQKTVSNFNRYMTDQKMRAIRGESYRAILYGMFVYQNPLSEEEYKQISKDFQKAAGLLNHGIDDTCTELTLEAIRRAYLCGVISAGYVDFIEKYIKSTLQSSTDKIQVLRPLLDFINENMRGKNFEMLEFYRKELEKRIYRRVDGFQFVCITDEMRENMFDYLKPEYKSRYDLDVTNINWTTGVYNKETGVFLTEIYYVSDGIARCGVNYHSYIVITDDGMIFRVDNNDEYEKRTYDFRIPEQHKALTDTVKEGIDFYKRFACEYRSSQGDDTQKKLKAVHAEMDDRCRRNYPIHSEEDAHALFALVNCRVQTILDIYNQKTIHDFNRFAPDDLLLHWRGERYLQLLHEVTEDARTKQERCRIFKSACALFSTGVDALYDEQFLQAVRYLYAAGLMEYHMESTLRNYLNAYVEEYPDKLQNVIPLIQFLKAHAKDKYLKETTEKLKKTLGVD